MVNFKKKLNISLIVFTILILCSKAFCQIEIDHNLPIVKLLGEPDFTFGNYNFLYFYIEPLINDSLISIDSDTLHLNKFDVDIYGYVITAENDTNAGIATVRADSDSTKFPMFDKNLFKKDHIGKEIHYKARLSATRYEKKEKVSDWGNIVTSTQDIIKPEINPDTYSFLSECNRYGWYKEEPKVFIECSITDSAGIHSVSFYKRKDLNNSWQFLKELYINPIKSNGKRDRTKKIVRKTVFLPEGNYEVTLGAYDLAYSPLSHDGIGDIEPVWEKNGNNAIKDSALFHVYIDTTPSSITLYPLNEYQIDSVLTLRLNVIDSLSGIDSVWIKCEGPENKQYIINTNIIKGTKDTTISKNDTLKLGMGEYKFWANCIDLAGNEKQSDTVYTTLLGSRFDSLVVRDRFPEGGIEAKSGWTNDSTVIAEIYCCGLLPPDSIIIMVNKDIIIKKPDKESIEYPYSYNISISKDTINKICALVHFPDTILGPICETIQYDYIKPIIESVNIKADSTSRDIHWVYERKIEVSLKGKDNNQIYLLLILDNKGIPDTTVIRQSILYTTKIISISNEEKHELKFTLFDVAGNSNDIIKVLKYKPKDLLEEIIAFPNPFIPLYHTTITIMINDSLNNDIYTQNLYCYIYDVFGNLIRRLTPKGKHIFRWDGKNENGDEVASGGYIAIINKYKQKKFKIFVLK